MKISKTVYLILALIFLFSFIQSLFDARITPKIFFWEVNIWVYRLFRLAVAVLFMKSYLDMKKEEKKTAD
ncbi:hypothetical protein [Flavobacterium hiemivividum]|uniref:Uncharacterized protein n=1 Tax=Flavobacterium hiemivividum TaxID=2541734 RepID=A0A4R5CSS4_9FLAO|nr:hypothetical protein [Flavobacterium hiemivividum]TDE02627.1 hypothetical protein E0F98_12505 [Flavobacterium hiemivividum]